MPETVYTRYCPRCDRPKSSTKSLEGALQKVSDHVRDAHPDMDNYIQEEIDDAKEA